MTSTNTGQLVVRHASSRDRAQLVELMGALQQFEHELHPSRGPGEPMAAEHLRFLERVAGAREGVVLVAELAERAVGFLVAFVEHEEDGDLHLDGRYRRRGHISDLYVRPEMRRRGIARALLTAAESHLRNVGVEFVNITYLATNPDAGEFYASNHYGPYEVIVQKRLE